VRPDDLSGAWQQYYEKWPMMTREVLGNEMVDLVPELRILVPPATVFDKGLYSPRLDGRLHRHLREQEVTTLVVSGGETDVCVLAAVMGAVDLGYAIVLLREGICSTSDQTHDASLELFGSRFSSQLRLSGAAEVLDWWR
jgi:nicotinamidase-related amidase